MSDIEQINVSYFIVYATRILLPKMKLSLRCGDFFQKMKFGTQYVPNL